MPPWHVLSQGVFRFQYTEGFCHKNDPAHGSLEAWDSLFPQGETRVGWQKQERHNFNKQPGPEKLLCPFGLRTSLLYPEIPGQPWAICRLIYQEVLAKKAFLAWWPWDSSLAKDIAATGEHQCSDSAIARISAWEVLCLPKPEIPLLLLRALGPSAWGTPSAPPGSTIRDHCHQLPKQVKTAPQSFWI